MREKGQKKAQIIFAGTKNESSFVLDLSSRNALIFTGHLKEHRIFEKKRRRKKTTPDVRRPTGQVSDFLKKILLATISMSTSSPTNLG